LLRFATELEAADQWMSARITPELLAAIVWLIPDTWLQDEPSFTSKAEHRQAYLHYLVQRLAGPRAFAQEAIRAATLHV
jgi:hypothetical protein